MEEQELVHQVQEATDQRYPGVETAAQKEDMCLAVLKLPEAKQGFVLLPRRGAVERSFAWVLAFDVWRANMSACQRPWLP